jgi:pilus assembly protein CpaB
MAERRYTTIFAFAVLTAGVATFGIYRVLQASKARNKIQTQPVVVALQDISEGRSVERPAVAVAQWPVGTVPAGAFTNIDSVVGRVTRIDVFKGEVIVPGRLAPNGTEPGLAVKITPGKRAVAVRIDDVAGLNGLIQPNSRVDVLVTLPDVKHNNQQLAKLFMSNMRVLSVGTISQTSRDNRPIQAPTATLEVTPEEAERLAIAQQAGRIQLALRGYGDPDSIKTEGANSADVLAQLRDAPEAKPTSVASRRPARSSSSGSGGGLIDNMRGAGKKVGSGFGSAASQLGDNGAAAVVMPQAEPVPPKPKTPDTVAVQVYKGDKLDTKKFVKPDSGKKPTP